MRTRAEWNVRMYPAHLLAGFSSQTETSWTVHVKNLPTGVWMTLTRFHSDERRPRPDQEKKERKIRREDSKERYKIEYMVYKDQ